MTATMAAVVLGITDSQVRRLCLAGRLPGARRHGRDWLIPASTVVTSLLDRLARGAHHDHA